MSTASEASVRQHPHFNHLFTVGVLYRMACNSAVSQATRDEAAAELRRYRDEGINSQKYGRPQVAKKKSRAHEPRTFSGQGIIFAVVDDREQMPTGRVSTIDVITDAIEQALDAGHETSEEIARYLTTSAFQHIPDKRVRFNSVLKAGDVVGAQMLRKLYNSFNELAVMYEEEEDPKAKADLKAEARGFAEAVTIVMSPFSCEAEDPRLVNWDEVDRITDNFEKEQRLVRRERKGKPQ